MKTFCLLIWAFCLAGILDAQIPNGGFDDWTSNTFGGIEYDTVSLFDTPNRITTALGGDSSDMAVYPLSKRLDLGMAPAEGSNALVLETKSFLAGGILDLYVPGLVTSNKQYFDLLSPAFGLFDAGGAPFTDRPTSFELQYKYNPVAGDSLYAQVELFSGSTLIGFGSFETGTPSGTWTSMSIVMTYTSGVSPDKLRFAITSSKNLSPFATGTAPASSGSLAIIDGIASLCNPSDAPASPTTTVLPDGLQLSWDPLPGSESCRVRVVPAGGPSLFRFLPAGQYSLFVANSKITPGTTFMWSVQCACSLVPPILTPETTPLSYSARMGNWPQPTASGEWYPNPASHSVYASMYPAGSTVRILDMLGRLLATKRVGAGNMVDLTDLPVGCLAIVGPDGQSFRLVHTP